METETEKQRDRERENMKLEWAKRRLVGVGRENREDLGGDGEGEECDQSI